MRDQTKGGNPARSEREAEREGAREDSERELSSTGGILGRFSIIISGAFPSICKFTYIIQYNYSVQEFYP